MSGHDRSGHAEVDHNPARLHAHGAQRIVVRAVLGAGGHEPRVALMIPGVPQQVRLSASEAEQLASAIVQTLGRARERLALPSVQPRDVRHQATGDPALLHREEQRP